MGSTVQDRKSLSWPSARTIIVAGTQGPLRDWYVFPEDASMDSAAKEQQRRYWFVASILLAVVALVSAISALLRQGARGPITAEGLILQIMESVEEPELRKYLRRGYQVDFDVFAMGVNGRDELLYHDRAIRHLQAAVTHVRANLDTILESW